jgi:hypothetical protein
MAGAVMGLDESFMAALFVEDPEKFGSLDGECKYPGYRRVKAARQEGDVITFEFPEPSGQWNGIEMASHWCVFNNDGKAVWSGEVESSPGNPCCIVISNIAGYAQPIILRAPHNAAG